MAKMVGLARPLKIEWMNKTVDLLLEGKAPLDVKEELNEFLSFEIDSPTSLRKTRESLINTWVNNQEGTDDLRKTALQAYSEMRSKSLALHWCMLVASYPIFADISSLIGKVSTIEDTFSTMWIREKLYESWGERTTLDVPVKNILRTMVDFGTLEKVKTGIYKIKQQPILDDAIIRVIVLTILSLKQKAYYEITDLPLAPQMFPFVFDVTHEFIYNTGCFELSNFGGKAVLTPQ